MIESLMGMLACSAAVNAAVDTSMIDALVRLKRTTSDRLARSLRIDPHATARVLDILVAIRLATRDGDTYALSDEARRGLALLPGGLTGQSQLWRHATDLVRTGAPFTYSESPVERESSYAGGVTAMGRQFEPFARAFAERLGGRFDEILDVGCGSGVWSLAIAARSPHARVTGSDLPRVLDAFRANASLLGLRDRVDTLPGDMHAIRFPRRKFDLAVVANVLRLEPPNACRSLLRRIAGALRPGGTLIVIDALARGSDEASVSRAVYALHLALRTRGRSVHAPEDVAAWLSVAGLGEARAIPIDDNVGALAAIVARARTTTKTKTTTTDLAKVEKKPEKAPHDGTRRGKESRAVAVRSLAGSPIRAADKPSRTPRANLRARSARAKKSGD